MRGPCVGIFIRARTASVFYLSGRKKRWLMELWEIALTGFSLAMDAFVVSMCKGVEMKKFIFKYALLIAVSFALFQMIMPLIGWGVVTLLRGAIEGGTANGVEIIQKSDHWIAFILLGFLGVKMIADSIKPWCKKRRAVKRGEEYEEETPAADAPVKLGVKTLLVMSVATSIDALAVGVTFGLLESTNIWIAIGIIGAITLVLCLTGVVIGIKVGAKFQHKAEFLGGLVLIALGLKILIEHLIA